MNRSNNFPNLTEREINVSVGKTALVGVLNYSNDGEAHGYGWRASAWVSETEEGRRQVKE